MTSTQDFRITPTHTLPERPHLDHLRGEARSRLAAMKAISPNARLSDAQFLLARSYGFASWMTLKAEVDRRRLLCGAVEMPVAMMLRPAPSRRRTLIANLASPATAEAALFPATLAGFALAQLAQIGGSVAALLHLLLH